MKKKFIEHFDTSGMNDAEIKGIAAIGDVVDKMLEANKGEEFDPKAFKASLVEEMKGMDEFKKQSVEGFVKSADFDAKVKDITDEILSIKSMTEKGGTGKQMKSITEQIEEQMKPFFNEKGFDVHLFQKSGNGHSIKLVTKADANVSTTSGAGYVAGGLEVDNTITPIPVQRPTLREMANATRTRNTSITFAEMASVTGEAEWVPEGGLKPSMVATLTNRIETVKKVALFYKTTKEVLSDIPQFRAELDTELLNKVNAKEEEDILNGDGVGENLKGFLADVPAFSLTGLSVTNPNMYDAIVAAYTQIVSVSGMNYAPNAIRMNPVDYANMQLTKNANGDYIRPFKIGDELITGLRVVQTDNQEVGSFVMGDWRFLNIRDYEEFNLSFGWENQDFTKNQITVIGEKRLVSYVKTNHLLAFVADTFANVITAITA